MDAKDEDGEEEASEKETPVETAASAQGHTTAPSWVHRRNLGGNVNEQEKNHNSDNGPGICRLCSVFICL